VDHNKLCKILKEIGIPDHLTFLLRNLYAGQKATVITKHGSKLGKEYVKSVYCHPAYLTYMQSTSCEMPGWMNHKLESRLPGEISITSDIQVIPPFWQKVPLIASDRWWPLGVMAVLLPPSRMHTASHWSARTQNHTEKTLTIEQNYAD